MCLARERSTRIKFKFNLCSLVIIEAKNASSIQFQLYIWDVILSIKRNLYFADIEQLKLCSIKQEKIEIVLKIV